MGGNPLVPKSIFKRFLLGGWALLIAGIFFVIFFPNARWVPTVVWISALVLIPVTLGCALYVGARAGLKLVRGSAHRLSSAVALKASASTSRRKWVFGAGAAAVIVLSVLTFTELSLRSSTVYGLAVQKARASPGVISALGQPLHEGWFVLGKLSVSSNGSGQASLAIPLQGPKGKGKLDVEAIRQKWSWRFLVLRFVADGRVFAVDLLEDTRSN